VLKNRISQEDLTLVEKTANQLHIYLQACNYAGYDPFDGLESRVFKVTPFSQFKSTRLAWIQFVKRFPISLRPLLLVPRGRNPKGIALCASALLELGQVWEESHCTDEAQELLAWLVGHQAEGGGWAYNFDWQSRGFFAPKGTPNIICTVFAASAFLDGYETTRTQGYLDTALSSCSFILERLLRSKGDDTWFSYTPLDNLQVHNANLWGAALLARVYQYTGEEQLRQSAERAVHFSVRRQNADGSWYYGEASSQNWIDSFHTGYNLVALKNCQDCCQPGALEKVLSNGYEFFDRHFFRHDGMPRYYHDRAYPIDLHCSAEGILTYLKFQDQDSGALENAIRIARWAIEHMYKRDHFYYRKHRFYTNRIDYTRWTQAWMFYALAKLANTNR
jgi:hypothetical protein